MLFRALKRLSLFPTYSKPFPVAFTADSIFWAPLLNNFWESKFSRALCKPCFVSETCDKIEFPAIWNVFPIPSETTDVVLLIIPWVFSMVIWEAARKKWKKLLTVHRLFCTINQLYVSKVPRLITSTQRIRQWILNFVPFVLTKFQAFFNQSNCYEENNKNIIKQSRYFLIGQN